MNKLDTLALLSRLSNANVEFVVIGGIAAIAHGGAVTTEDPDVCAPLTHENAVSFIQALSDGNPRWRMRPDLPVITPENHNLKNLKNLYLRTDFGQLDVLGELPGVCAYNELETRTVEFPIAGVLCRLIDVDTLIAVKRAAGRDRDLRTIAQLEANRRP